MHQKESGLGTYSTLPLKSIKAGTLFSLYWRFSS